MIGKDFKSLVRSYKEFIGNYYSIYEFMELDEEILNVLIINEEDNFVDENKLSVLFECAFMNAETDFVKLLLTRMKTVSYEECVILKKIAEVINDSDINDSIKLSYLTAVCKYGFNFKSLNGLNKYLEEAQTNANIDYINVFEDESIVEKITKIKLEIACLGQNKISNLLETIINTLRRRCEREKYQEDYDKETSFCNIVITALYDKIELLTSYKLKQELYAILSNINYFINSFNQTNIVKLLEVLEHIDFDNVRNIKDMVNKILSDSLYYSKILEVCDAFGIDISDNTYDLILRICKSKPEVYEKYISFARKHHINELEFDLSICLDSSNYNRLEELSKLVESGKYTIEELLYEDSTLYSEIGSALEYAESVEEILSLVPDDAEIKKETISFRFKNNKY